MNQDYRDMYRWYVYRKQQGSYNKRHRSFEVYTSTLGGFGNIKVAGSVDQVLAGTRYGNF